ncbi:MAG: universal stress protein [Chloroflexota bacterium]
MGYHHIAIEDFRRARRQAAVQDLLGRLSGRPNELLVYDEIRRQLRATNLHSAGLHDIPLDAIVGSVGRARDFTRDFLPRNDSYEQRWARVKTAVNDMAGVPPIEVYKIGDAYFVIDGNHRVSVARQLGVPTISAYVTEVDTRVPLSPDDNPEELICKSRYAEFLEKTNLDHLRPAADLLMTFCGSYRLLEEHIEVHRYFMGLDWQQDVGWEEAVVHWYDTVYLPIVELIRERGLLHEFPGRTETDLYVLLAEYRAELEEALGWPVESETVADQLADSKGRRPSRVMARWSERLRSLLTPENLESGPPAGEWRRGRLAARRDERLFADILVAARGAEADMAMLDHAILIAQREGARLLGFHVRKPLETEAEMESARNRFQERCQAAGVPFAASSQASDSTAREIVARAVWADLVVLHLSHPPGEQIVERLGSGFSKIIHRSPRPILAVPTGVQSPLDRALLAYDGSTKAQEALFMAAYIVQRWSVQLAVVTVLKDASHQGAQDEAQAYLENQGVTAVYHQRPRPDSGTSQAILEVAAEENSNLLLIGGYHNSPIMQVVLGSTLDRRRREFSQPMLICR